jgi:hypothetical protein
MKHSNASPSKAHRFLKCPGSLAFVESLPESRTGGLTGKAAYIGTVAHLVLQTSLEDARSPANLLDRYAGIMEEGSAEWIADNTESYAKVVRVDSEMVASVHVAYEYALNRAKELGAKLETETLTNPLFHRDDTSGIADISLLNSEVLEVIDYKNGYVVVETEGNPQLLAYLLGKAIEAKWQAKVFFVTIIQPNAYHKAGPIRRVEVGIQELLTFEEDYGLSLDKVDRAREEFGTCALEDWARAWLSAGDHCLWCKAQGVCAVRAKDTLESVRLDFEDHVTEEGTFDDIAAALSIYQNADKIRAHLNAAELYLEKALLDGATVPGYHLKELGSKRIWSPSIPRHQLLSSLLSSNYLDERGRERVKENWPMTGAQVEKLVRPGLRAFFSGDFLYRPAGNQKIVKKVED